eukprot:gene13560-20191_t
MGPHRPFLVGSSSGTIHDNDGAAHPNLPSTQPRLQLQNPDDNDLFKLSTFAKKDEEEINSTTTFGLRAGRERSRRRIVGGISASPGSYKFMALVYFVDTAGNAYQCGGVLVKPDILLTSAHCMHSSDGQILRLDLERSIAYVGMTQKSDRFTNADPDPATNLNANHRVARLADVLVHTKYDAYNHAYDIAAVRLQIELTAWPTVKLAKVGMLDLQPPLTALGWGSTDASNPTKFASTLNVVVLDTITLQQCRAASPTWSAAADCASPNFPAVNTDVTSLRSWVFRAYRTLWDRAPAIASADVQASNAAVAIGTTGTATPQLPILIAAATITSRGCTCESTWSTSRCSSSNRIQSFKHCGMATPCDGDDHGIQGLSWCTVVPGSYLEESNAQLCASKVTAQKCKKTAVVGGACKWWKRSVCIFKVDAPPPPSTCAARTNWKVCRDSSIPGVRCTWNKFLKACINSECESRSGKQACTGTPASRQKTGAELVCRWLRQAEEKMCVPRFG